MNIRTYGTDERLVFCREYLYRGAPSGIGEILLLPIPSSRGVDKERVISLVSESIAKKGSEAGSREGETVVAGYGIPKDIKDALVPLGALTVDVSLDEEFLLENSRLTAIATLGKLLSEENAAPCELSIGIIGLGRIGRALLGLLLPLGAVPIVFTGNEAARLELGLSGIPTAPYSALRDADAPSELAKLDYLINTAPARMVGEGAAGALRGARILELASGDNFPEGLEVVRLPSLPAKKYPRSAGKCLALSILRMLGEGRRNAF